VNWCRAEGRRSRTGWPTRRSRRSPLAIDGELYIQTGSRLGRKWTRSCGVAFEMW
jgi:hypothetical protein